MEVPNDNRNPETSPSKNLDIKYKHRAIKVYASDEWMADATKKYRRVFDRYEVTYMRAEFSFFNKLFDESEWEASVRLKCFFLNGSERRELCNLETKRKILKDENVVYVRQSWGTDVAGGYWFRGDYIWEGYIDEVKVAEAKFHIEDLGVAKEGENLFFDIESIKLFEGNAQAYLEQTKKYLTTFKQADTRHVWCEFKLKNKPAKDYYAEVFFNFYNDAGQLKGSHDYMQFITANTAGQTYTLFPGWGGDSPGRWSKDTYTLEVVFLDKLLAVVPFDVGDEAVEGVPVVHTDNASVFKAAKQSSAAAASTVEKTGDALLQEALAELNSLTGLVQIKNEINEMVQLVRYYQEIGKDILSRFSLHTVFTGNPGTGKTTVARILSRIYKGLGILSKGHLVECDREGLVAGFIGQTAIKTAEKVNESMGGILFIDEAYSLSVRGTMNDFGSEAIQVILKRMEDNRGKFGVIVAGYTGNMVEFIESNPGLKSRFDKYFEFPDYAPHEMWAIAESMFKREEVTPDDAAKSHLYNYFNYVYERRDHHFGNARTVRQVVGECVKNQNLRLAAMKKEDRTKEMMAIIIFDDVKEFELKDNSPKASKIGFQTRKV